jgi:hypothetical protein
MSVVADTDAVGLLSAARDALQRLADPDPDAPAVQAQVDFAAAAESLTGLFQLHGCLWAGPELRRLYARSDAPALRLGYSPDGRVLLRVEPLELKNPAFASYSVLLCTFNSETARDVRDSGGHSLQLTLPGGKQLSAVKVTPSHPLWPQLSRQAEHFAPIGALPSGAGIAFKQLYAVPAGQLPLNACAVSLDWGGYRFDLPRWTEQAPRREDGSGKRRRR